MSQLLEDPTHGITLVIDSSRIGTRNNVYYIENLPKIYQLRSLRFKNASLPAIVPPMGGPFTLTYLAVDYTITLPTGRYDNGTDLATALQALIVASGAGAFTVAFSTVTGKLTITAPAANPFTITFTISDQDYQSTMTKCLRNSRVMGFYMNFTNISPPQPIRKVITTAFTSTAGGVLVSPYPINMAGPLYYVVQIENLKVDSYNCNGVDIDFYIPVNAVYGGIITYNDENNFKQAIQVFQPTPDQQIQTLYFNIVDDLGNRIDFGGNNFTLVFNATAFGQSF